MIQTVAGPVGLRRARDYAEIRLNRDPENKGKRQVSAKWLAKDGKSKKDADNATVYRSGVMQAMMIAATEVEIQDLSGRQNIIDPETGFPRTAAKTELYANSLRIKLANMKEGKTPVPLRLLTFQSVQQQGFFAARHHLMKRGQKTAFWTRRFFSIDGGKLREFISAHAVKPRHVYDLRDVDAHYENKDTRGATDEFQRPWVHRVKINRLRPGPIYLVSDDAAQAKSWERAVKMSKYLQSASDREALAFVVGRLAGSQMNKGWQALFGYFREMNETCKLVKNLAMRLMKVDLSRGWTKARLVYRSREESDKLKSEQKEWAAKFLQEKMQNMSCQSARSPKQVRHNIITLVQTKFRHYRQEKIFDRAYPLGSAVATRLQQAQAGTNMGAAFVSVTRDDALHLVLNDDSRMLLTTRPGIFHGRKSTYSEVSVPTGQLSVHVSESCAMLSFSELDEDAEHTHLAKEGWAHFVNLDQISSVVLNSERMMGTERGRPELSRSMTGGVWFTINGPRVCWCRQLRTYVDAKTKEVRKDLVGATNPLVVGSALAKGERLRWLKVSVQVRSSSIPKRPAQMVEEEMILDGDDQDAMSMSNPTERHVYLVLHLLGRQFRTDKVTGVSPTFPGRFETEVPISYDEQALASLDQNEVCVDIVEWSDDPNKCSTIFAGKLALWRIFGPEEAMDRITGDEKEDVVSLVQTLNTSAGRVTKVMALVPPTVPGELAPALPPARVELEVTARVQESTDPGRKCISPELQGRGPLATLFSTHRGAWFDPKLGEAKFVADRVANFIELAIMDLHFPEVDKADQHKLFRYHVVANCNGVHASTIQLYRAKHIWNNIIPGDPNKIDFQGAKLFLPLPPGAWCAHDVRPEIVIQVLRCSQNEERTLSLQELVNQNGKPGPTPPSFERVYHATVLLDGLLVDEVKEGARVFLSKASTPTAVVSLANGECSQVESPAVLRMNAALRDRDYMRLNATPSDKHDPNTLGQGFVLCAGDKAMMRVEEPLTYPQTELEFRRRCLPGVFSENHAKRGHASSLSAWNAPLRDPSLSHEYADSGLGSIKDAPAFRQRYLPTNCEDVIPYKFVLPPSEIEFMKRAHPGIYWRIMDHLVEQSVREQRGAPQNQHKPVIVEELSHLMHQVPCTVLAVYANDTCDVEVSPSFVEEWEGRPERHYSVPGSVIIKSFQDTSAAAMRCAPTGTGDVSERHRMRVILREVPIGLLVSVQPASFNIYDAAFGSVEDAIRMPPGAIGNDFNPRGFVDAEEQTWVSARKGGYSVHAGPVPSDAGPTCLYEWSLHLHASSEDSMYHFVTALRQAVRIDLHQQLLRLDDWKKKSALSTTTMPYRNCVMTTHSGVLEVVLVSARDLRPPRIITDNLVTTMSKMKENFAGTVKSVTNTFVELNPRAVFKIFRLRHHGSEQIGDPREVMVYRGSKVQASPEILGSNPNWAEIKELENSGGWVFKSPPFDPSQTQDVFFEIEFFHRRVSLGVVTVPVTVPPDQMLEPQSKRDISLCNAATPFQNLWLPIAVRNPSTMEVDPGNQKYPDGTPFLGKVHVMTQWVPQQETVKTKNLPKKAIDWRRYRLKPKLAMSSLREQLHEKAEVEAKQEHNDTFGLVVRLIGQPLESRPTRDALYETCEIQVHKRGYNPNIPRLCRDQVPPTRSEVFAAHVENMDDGIPFLECGQAQDEERWKAFKESFGDDPPLSFWELRQRWATDPAFSRQIDVFFRLGVVSECRKTAWWEITRAEEVAAEFMAKPFGRSPSEDSLEVLTRRYRDLVDFGRPWKHEAMQQLSEDLVGASAWENGENAALMDVHLARLNKTQDVCLALITFSLEFDDKQRKGQGQNLMNYRQSNDNPTGVAYCEGLFVIAFYMLLAVGAHQQRTHNEERYASSGRSLMASRTTSQVIKDAARQSQSYEDEAQVFWILYTISASRKNMAFLDYFGIGPSASSPAQGMRLLDRVGPADDVHLLDVCLSKYEPELWVRLNAIGVHLTQIFYGPFSRLFATFMPTATVFRYWDLLLLESAPRTDRLTDRLGHKPQRHTLIDLAFATLRKCKDDLMECQSALEAKCVVLDFLERQYDPSDVIALVTEAEGFLWNTTSHAVAEAVGFQPIHCKEYERRVNLWDVFMYQFKLQNDALRELVGGCADQVTPAVATREMRKIRALFASESIERGQWVGLQRCVPAIIRKFGPPTDQTLVGTLSTWFSRMTENVMVEDISRPIAVSIPRPPEMPGNSLGEPNQMDNNDFERQMRRISPAWAPHLSKIFVSFVSQNEKRLSINEYLTSLVCASRGTVGEKAMSFFAIFASVQPQTHTMKHITNVSHTAETIVDKIDNTARKAEGTVTRAPKPQDYKNHALHFQVYTHGSAMGKDMLLGEVFVPSMRPYMWSSMGQDVRVDLPIWGMENRLPPGVELSTANAAALVNDHGVRQRIGAMNMSVKWMAQSEQMPESGQLGLRLFYIEFDQKLIEAHRLKNPKVAVYTYDEQGTKVQIKRWDPRTTLGRSASAVTADYLAGGAYGDHMLFYETMRRDPVKGTLLHRAGSGKDHGWFDGTGNRPGQWRWSQKWGDQYSVEGTKMRKEVVKTSGTKPNTVSLRACRFITKVILSRCLMCVTNRQALVIADEAFNRSGAVPGILDAFLVPADAVNPTFTSAGPLKKALDGARRQYLDVTHQVLLAHEESMDKYPGNISLFPGTGTYSLSNLDVADPFPSARKVLWIRYARAGDGQRFNAAIQVNPDGTFPGQSIQLDMETESVSGIVQMSVTKEEFVTCLMSSPLLSESLRRLTTTNSSTKSVDKHERSINLDVIIADPTHEAEQDEFMDAVNVRQGVVFELWDYDISKKDDFLGECWLPSLSLLTAEPQHFVLPVVSAPEQEDSTQSRPARSYKYKNSKPIPCQGQLFVEASWKCPHKEVPEASGEQSLEDRVKREEALHTGELYVKIVKAVGLKLADKRLLGMGVMSSSLVSNLGSDPYVYAYVRNETWNSGDKIPGIGDGGWRKSIAGFDEPLMKTKTKMATVNPVWDEVFKVLLPTGAFEKRTKRAAIGAHLVDPTGRSAQRRKDDHALDVLHGIEDLRIFFGSSDGSKKRDEPGHRHRREIFMSDTIHQFKKKLMLACLDEAEATGKEPAHNEDAISKREKRKNKYRDVSRGLSYRHAAMVFVPSQKLRELAQHLRTDGKELRSTAITTKEYEYKRLYRIEEQDPSSWQPLDTIRSFEHYKALYGFGMDLPQRLRIVEGSDDYKIRNTRYRQFEDDQKKWTRKVEFTNTDSECFGWAKYLHKQDGNSVEWRQAIVARPETGSDGRRRCNTWFIHGLGASSSPGVQGPLSGPLSAQAVQDDFDLDDILLAPANPRLLASASSEHQEFLAQARYLKEAEGLNDSEIVVRLNAKMKSQYAKQSGLDTEMPDAITLTDVQQVMKSDSVLRPPPQML